MLDSDIIPSSAFCTDTDQAVTSGGDVIHSMHTTTISILFSLSYLLVVPTGFSPVPNFLPHDVPFKSKLNFEVRGCVM